MSAADRHAGDRLAALADGRLSDSKRDQVLAHLGRCARCRSDYDEQLTMKGVLGDLGSGAGLSAPPDLRARLSDLARPVPTPPAPGRPPRRSTRPARSARRRTARAGAGLV
jgi:anti-sigma factor RsiW